MNSEPTIPYSRFKKILSKCDLLNRWLSFFVEWNQPALQWMKQNLLEANQRADMLERLIKQISRCPHCGKHILDAPENQQPGTANSDNQAIPRSAESS